MEDKIQTGFLSISAFLVKSLIKRLHNSRTNYSIDMKLKPLSKFLYICRLIFLDCMFIFFQYTLNEQLMLRRKIRTRKKSCNFLKMQLFIRKGTQEVTQTEAKWRSKNKIFLSPEDVWSANVVGCWRVVRQNPKLSYVTLWSRDHKKSRIKLKTKYQGL